MDVMGHLPHVSPYQREQQRLQTMHKFHSQQLSQQQQQQQQQQAQRQPSGPTPAGDVLCSSNMTSLTIGWHALTSITDCLWIIPFDQYKISDFVRHCAVVAFLVFSKACFGVTEVGNDNSSYAERRCAFPLWCVAKPCSACHCTKAGCCRCAVLCA